MRLLVAVQGESLERLASPAAARWVASLAENALRIAHKHPVGTLFAVEVNDTELTDVVAGKAVPVLQVPT